MKILWVVLAGLLVLIWLFFPAIFNWWALNIWHVPNDELGKIGDLGPLGDIYGSLNTLFTSVTLVIVLYSVFLQRQANQDAREAMAKQLSQARDATAKQLLQASQASKQQLEQAKKALEAQLKQAREANMEQIINSKSLSNIQLDQAREATIKQLALARATHDAQIRESRYAIFVSMFNGSMALKQTKLESLKIKNSEREYIGFEIFNYLAHSFSNSFDNQFCNVNLLTENEVKNHFFRILKELNGDQKYYDLGSFFLLYENLLNLIHESGLDIDEKEYFKAAVRNSMSGAEQLTLFWMGAYSPKFKLFLKDSQLFSQFYSDKMMPFAIKFHDKSSFSHPTILMNWDRFSNEKTPA